MGIPVTDPRGRLRHPFRRAWARGPARPVPAGSRARPWGRRAAGGLAEVVLGVGVALGFTAWGASIDESPVTRAGQVSALAALQLRFALVALPLLVLVAVTTVHGPATRRRMVLRLSCAAVAGLVTGLLGAGQVYALRGTPWPLAGVSGDDGRLILMAREVIASGATHSFYPPLVPYLMAAGVQHLGVAEPAFVLKQLLIGAVALTGPLTYAAWRLSVRPLAALCLAVVPGLPQFLPYKSYSPLVLLLLLPLLVRLLMWLRVSRGLSLRGALGRGAALGAASGLVFLLYSGWHVWAVPGASVAVLACFPWRGGRRRLGGPAVLLAGAGAAFLVVAGRYLWVLLHAVTVKDSYCSLVTLTQPGYFGPSPLSAALWNQPGVWPPLGEFAGLGVFMLVLVVGAAVAVWLGLSSPLVVAPLAVLAGAWLARFWIASHLARDQASQLFPRTANVVQACLAVLLVAAALLVLERGRALVRLVRQDGSHPGPMAPVPHRFGAVGVLLGVALVGAMSGSALTDAYLPQGPSSPTAGSLAWNAHQIRLPDGQCPAFADGGRCGSPAPPGPLPADVDYATSTPSPDFARQCVYPWQRPSTAG